MADLSTDFERLRQAHLAAIHDLIDGVVAGESPPDSSLVEMCRYHLGTGGKRLRAILPLAVAEACGVEAAELVPFGAACEMLHNATLVHDDLQDGDRMRRGEQTVWARYGEPQAINLGDAMLYWTLLIAGRLECAPTRRERIYRRILAETLRVVDGQEREFRLKNRPAPAIEDYFGMVAGKTSGLFALPIAGAAEFCNAVPDLIASLEVAAGHLGVLFQIQDDVLDLYGNKGREHRGTDLCEGKISALVVHFLAHAPDADSRQLRRLLDAPREAIDAADIDAAAAAFRAHGSLDFALDEIARRRRLAAEDPGLAGHSALAQLVASMADWFVEPIAGLLSV